MRKEPPGCRATNDLYRGNTCAFRPGRTSNFPVLSDCKQASLIKKTAEAHWEADMELVEVVFAALRAHAPLYLARLRQACTQRHNVVCHFMHAYRIHYQHAHVCQACAMRGVMSCQRHVTYNNSQRLSCRAVPGQDCTSQQCAALSLKHPYRRSYDIRFTSGYPGYPYL